MNDIGRIRPITNDIKNLIDSSRLDVALAVNSEITLLYWKVGQRISEEVLQNSRAGYGKQIVVMLSRHLTEDFGKGWGEKHLRLCIQFAESFPDIEIVYALRRQLSWTHLRMLIPIEKYPICFNRVFAFFKKQGIQVKSTQKPPVLAANEVIL